MKVNKISISVSAHSEKGTRPINEDFYMFEKNGAGQLLAVVCDGIGGDDDSQVASKAVTSQFRDEFLAKKKITNFVRFYNKILTTSTKIINKKTLKGSKMGTTVCALLITGTTVEIANIGDSRIYYYSYQNNSWKQLSWDHNLFNFLRAKYQKQRELHPGWITQINQEEQKALEANKNSLIALTKCVETGTKIKKDDSWYKVIQDVKTDDLFYICTDGVYHWIKNERINNIVKETQNFDDVAKKVVAEAIANKSNDNLTAIVIRINGNK